jgi:Histidine kinase-like ATPase domain
VQNGSPPLPWQAGISVDRRLPQEPASVALARGALKPLESAVDPDTFETLRLLVSELMTNSVRHGTGDGAAEITLSVKASRERIRVEVADDGLAGTAPPGEGDAERAGWDLHFIQVLSDRCGIDGEGQECAWCELVDSGAFPSRAAR